MVFITIGDIHLKKSIIDSIEYRETPDGTNKYSILIKTRNGNHFAHYNSEDKAKKAFETAKKELDNDKNYPDSLVV